MSKNPDDGLDYFVKPLEVDEPFSDFLRYVRDQESGNLAAKNVKYAQTQHDNLRGEYALLYKDVQEDIPWARIALGQPPDAINLWIGNSRSRTALHRDIYENLYYQIIGSEQFVLLPPIETACVNERSLPCATYAIGSDSKHGSVSYLSGKGHLTVCNIVKENLIVVPDRPEETVPCATWDPDEPEHQETQFSHLSRPIRVELNAGDLLYLPALW